MSLFFKIKIGKFICVARCFLETFFAVNGFWVLVMTILFTLFSFCLPILALQFAFQRYQFSWIHEARFICFMNWSWNRSSNCDNFLWICERKFEQHFRQILSELSGDCSVIPYNFSHCRISISDHFGINFLRFSLFLNFHPKLFWVCYTKMHIIFGQMQTFCTNILTILRKIFTC